MAGNDGWYYADGQKPVGPMSLEQLLAALPKLGGEGLFFATLTGPGKVWLQSLPFSRLADRIIASAPKAGGKRRGEGSVLGGLGGLLDDDND